MGLRVIGAGLGRTGTTSLQQVLGRLLGGRCYHMDEVREHGDEHAEAWAAAYRGELPDWARLLDGYVAAVDWPAAAYWRELSEDWPDALILLSVRDPDSWWRSASTTIWPAIATYFAPDADDNGWTHMGVGMMTRFTPDWREEHAAKAAFVAHNDTVRRHAPPDRLLEWQVSEGWAPICERLGLPIPDEPFPHVNTAADMRAALGLD